MPDPAKFDFSERDICAKFLTPAIEQAGWLLGQFREEVKLTAGRVMVRGNIATRIRDSEVKGGPKRADYVFYAKPNVALAVMEAKWNRFGVGKGMPQALDYAEMLDAPFAISSNGDGFLLHDRTGLTQPVERPLALTEFPTYGYLWGLYQQWKSFSQPEQIDLISQPYFNDGSGREPHYFQRVATNRAIEARRIPRCN
jgi:type I restriction enzyme R subunit